MGEEWALVAPYRTLLPDDAWQRRYPLREVFNACCLLTNFPPGPIVYQQTQRWIKAGCCAALVNARRTGGILRRPASVRLRVALRQGRAEAMVLRNFVRQKSD